jgi:hypothetical protein
MASKQPEPVVRTYRFPHDLHVRISEYAKRRGLSRNAALIILTEQALDVDRERAQ